VQSSFPLRLISRRDSAHEDAFLSRYKALSEHSLKLTRRNRDVASDLLQDTFVYGKVAKRREIIADGTLQNMSFDILLKRSSWVALRILPSAHAAPIFISIGGQPVRVSKRSAQ
jgi:hypothetical protein